MAVIRLPASSSKAMSPCLGRHARIPRLQAHRQRARAAQDSRTNTRIAALDTSIASPSAPESTSVTRRRIAVDVDEVLGRFLVALNAYCLEAHQRDHDVSDFFVYDFSKIWNCDQETSNHIVHEFFNSPHFNEGIPIMPGAVDALQRLKVDHDLVVVTSRQHVIRDVTMEWLDRHFPDTFSDVYFGNHFAKSGVSKKKSEICQEIGAHILIDDNPSYAYDCASNGLQVLLYNWNLGYPWSEMPEEMQHENITVVQHWDDVERALEALPALSADSS